MYAFHLSICLLFRGPSGKLRSIEEKDIFLSSKNIYTWLIYSTNIDRVYYIPVHCLRWWVSSHEHIGNAELLLLFWRLGFIWEEKHSTWGHNTVNENNGMRGTGIIRAWSNKTQPHLWFCEHPLELQSWSKDYFKMMTFEIQQIQKEVFLELPLFD